MRAGQTKRGGQPNLFKAACEMRGRDVGQERGGEEGGMKGEGERRKAKREGRGK